MKIIKTILLIILCAVAFSGIVWLEWDDIKTAQECNAICEKEMRK